MKSKLKRIFSAFLSAAVVTCTLPVSVVTTSAEESVSYQCDAQSITNIQEGVILHCFDWKYTDIIAELPNIAAAGFNAVQTSPAQPAVNYSAGQNTGIWWQLYQPLDFCIGTNWLGTKEELQQLCTEAHKYGIEVIVDIVSNHLAGDHTNINANLKPSQYWHETKTEDQWKNYPDKRYATTHKDLGMPDIASENSYVQECVHSYIEELYSVGVDGLRWDTLKHIQLPVDINETNRCDFFTTVLNHQNYSNKYNYGEILGSPDGNNDAQNIQLMTEYTGLMSVTDDTYGKNLRDAFNEGKVPTTTGNWVNRGMAANTLVYWGESHDTWSNNKNYGYSNEMSQNVIDKAYAVAAGRADTTSLYFSRPSETVKDNILAGVKGSVHFKDAEVAAVNHFHNAFIGRSEYLSTWKDVVCTERGTKGAVLVSAKKTGITAVDMPVYRMADGAYTDQVTGSTFTVENGIISGTIGETGIAVVYNPNDMDEPAANSTLYFKPDSTWSSSAYFAMYLFNKLNADAGNTWVSMTSAGNGVYTANIPSGNWANVIFCGMKTNSGGNNWNNKEYQTEDLYIPTDSNILYDIASGLWTDPSCSHTYSEPEWRWNGNTTAVATFVCSECGHHVHKKATVSKNVTSTTITYQASVNFNGSDYPDSLPPIPRTKATTLRLKPNSNWPNDGARFAVYLKTGNTEAWASMTGPDSDGMYSAELPNHAYTDWENVIFCRMNGATTANNWDNKWNQTSYLAIPENGDDLYILNDGAWGDGNTTIGAWSRSAYVHTHSYSSPEWEWTDDYSSATATFECSGCDKTFTATDSAPAVDYISNIRTHTAAATGPDGESYTSPVKYETMVVQEDQTDGVKYQLTHQEQLIKLYQCVINQASFTDGATIDVSSCRIPLEDAGKAIFALIDIFPETNFIDKTQETDSEGNPISTADGKYLTGLAFRHYTMTKADFDTKSAAFYNKAKEYLSMLDNSMDDFTKALILHDQLVLNNYYQIESQTEYSSNYTFMINGWGRCENYAEVYAYLLAREGIKSEIIAYAGHEWMMVCLGGKYYHVDVTWDDPAYDKIAINTTANRPDKSKRTYFLLSDEAFKNEGRHGNGYNNYNKATDTFYDNHTNLHNNTNPIFCINGTLYTLYENNNNKGVIAVYNPENDTYTDKYTMTDSNIYTWWSIDNDGSYWPGNYSSIAEYNGLLYFNGECTVNTYNPDTNEVQTYCTYDGSDGKLYGMYIKDGTVYGLVAPDPNSEATAVSLGSVQQATYTVTWKNYDGTELKKVENVTAETEPDYDGETPTKPSTLEYSYTFSGWTAVTDDVTGDVTYTAQFTENPVEMLNVTVYNFINWDNVYIYYWKGEEKNATWPGVQLTATDSDKFVFTAAVPVTAENIIFNNGNSGGINQSPKITGNIEDGTVWAISLRTNGTEVRNRVIDSDYYLVGSMNEWQVNDNYKFAPNKDSEGGLEEYMLSVCLNKNDELKVTTSTKSDWFPSGNNYVVPNDANYTVYFRPNGNGGEGWYETYIKAKNMTEYTVTFKDGETTLSSQNVIYGEMAAAPETNPTKENYIFAGWYNGETEYDFSTPVTADIVLRAYWEENTVNISFIDVNGCEKTIEVPVVTKAFEIPKAANLDGRVFSGWQMNGRLYTEDEASSLKTAIIDALNADINSKITVTEVYTLKESDTQYTIAVENGTLLDGKVSKTCSPYSHITVKAEMNAENQIFLYWKKNNVIVSYEQTYTFIMPAENVTMNAVYGDSPVAEKKGTAYIESVTPKDSNKLVFVSVISVPDNCVIKEAGLVATNDEAIGSEISANSSVTEGKKMFVKTVVPPESYLDVKYTWTKGGIPADETWYVKAYVVYTSNSGGVYTEYGGLVTATLAQQDLSGQQISS